MKRQKKSERYAERATVLYLGGLSVEKVAEKLSLDYRTAREAILMRAQLRDPSARLVGRTRPDKRRS